MLILKTFGLFVITAIAEIVAIAGMAIIMLAPRTG
jgi:hypothetical protein